ncbi:hypothetical protein EZBTHKR_2773 [Elizabethkingia anophelis]|uniref:Uncharacterized protein n=1 Tax=Elizabethkingia anophelis TaxID=1117645 RepID=A0A455ZHR4_9FLAO|nr:hypothetical protein EZBTHKR_2773 [Elizabethkingia anophelis]DAC75554.1 TPA_exp: hypothetical protein [Elizabethkingia anophelis]DAC76328.1 TPA_exp: hypothetical protein [Elizabethkingia anophelis]
MIFVGLIPKKWIPIIVKLVSTKTYHKPIYLTKNDDRTIKEFAWVCFPKFNTINQ